MEKAIAAERPCRRPASQLDLSPRRGRLSNARQQGPIGRHRFGSPYGFGDRGATYVEVPGSSFVAPPPSSGGRENGFSPVAPTPTFPTSPAFPDSICTCAAP